MAELFNFKWGSHSTISEKLIGQLLTNQELTDVTLVSADGKSLEAHKVILGSISQKLKKIFSFPKSDRLVLYLSGLDYSTLEELMSFIYLGAATVNQTSFNSFLTACKDLEIQCLSDYSIVPAGQESESGRITSNIIDKKEEVEGTDQKLGPFQCDNCEFESPFEEELHSHSSSCQSVELKDYPIEVIDAKNKNIQLYVKSKRKPHEADKIEPTLSSKGELVYQCNKCDTKVTSKQNLKRHIDFVHEGLKVKCNICGKTFSDNSPLLRHIKKCHKNEMHYCNNCEFVTRSEEKLGRHIMKNHSDFVQGI